ncbi:hypothetical protein [Persicitalea jodogahamensis]|uniref:TMF family protein n=1 Tax=Persicitalea jodogahamensis TaxID=402147 RepID=A0A8J3GBL5_9BACT|nr:hypothetical protein [Persicitalea jodogahamensis]GHB82484.1 hypothetical protein GCM10007390_42030 [Persicitalea jodogahamensis]
MTQRQKINLCSILLLALLSRVSFAQNTVFTFSSSGLPGGGTGTANVVMGPSNTYPAADNVNQNVFIGEDAGISITTGNYNAFVGSNTGNAQTTGFNNSFLGSFAGNKNTTGNYNAFLGYGAGRQNTTGTNNVFVGATSGISNTTGNGNSFTGYYAGYQNKTGSSNSFVGYAAGAYNTFGSNNTFLGTFTNPTGPNKDNIQRATALGAYAVVGVNDGLVLGDTTNVKVGIGTAYPNQRFTLRGNINFLAYDNSMMIKNQPFLHFNEHESLALGLGAELPADAESTLVLGSSQTHVQLPGVAANYLANSGQVLTVDASGKVLLTKPRIQVQSTSEWADKVFDENYPLRPLNEVEDFVKKNKHLPGLPSAKAMVAEGMETAAFNTKLLEKIEELTLYVVVLEKRLAEIEKSPNLEQK